MACADVATAKAKTTAINLIILSSYVKHADLVTRVSPSAKASGSQDERYNTRFMNPVRRNKNG
jgi:hypothetical protein